MVVDPSVPPPALVATIHDLWAADDSKIGVAVIRSDQDWVIQYRGDERFPQQSVSKLWVAITVMDAIDKGRLSLDTQLTLRETDRTLFHQPITREIDPVNGLRITVRELLVRAMTKSDNTANDFLSKQVGGPAGVRAMIADKGLGNIRYGPGERDLQTGTAGMVWKPEYRMGRAFEAARAQVPLADRQAAMERYLSDPPDGAAPVAIARALLRLKRGDLLSRSSTAYLLNLMETSETGALRVKAGLPAGWRWAHKTGTGQNLNGMTAGFNDVGIMTAPDGTSYAVVILIGRTTKPVGTRQAFMQTVAASVGANHVTR
jgi:beta-lactamase class A